MVDKTAEWASKAESRHVKFRAVGKACKAIFWPTLDLKDRNLNSSGTLSRGDLTSASAAPESWNRSDKPKTIWRLMVVHKGKGRQEGRKEIGGKKWTEGRTGNAKRVYTSRNESVLNHSSTTAFSQWTVKGLIVIFTFGDPRLCRYHPVLMDSHE